MMTFITIVSCNKVVDNTGNTGTTTTTDTTKTNPLVTAVGTSDYNLGVYSFFKFFNVMDYGGVTIMLNDSTVASNIVQYYPSAYIKYNQRKVNIKVVFNSINVVSQDIDAFANNFYSIIVYKVGYNWKLSIINDSPQKMAVKKSGVRVLDFRTQAYFDYVNVRFTSPGADQLDFNKRNFLDHTTYSSYTRFDSLQTGIYNCYVYNDTTNLTIQKGINFEAGKYYSVLLLTPAAKTAADALKSITLDVEKHN
jgi:hypothetical protein